MDSFILLFEWVKGFRLPVKILDLQYSSRSSEKMFYQACLEGIAFTEAMVFDLIRSLGGTQGLFCSQWAEPPRAH